MGGFFLFYTYIFIYIHTHEYTPKHLRNYMCTGLILGQPDVMFVFAGHVCICWLIFLQQEEKRDKTPPEGGWKEPNEWPSQNIHLSERQRNRKRREKSAFNEAIKKEIKPGAGWEVFFVLSVQEYDTHMHKLTQAGHCQDSHPRGTRAERGPGALPPSVPLRARGRSVRHCGSPFPQRKNRPNPPPKHPHTHQKKKKKKIIISPPNLSDPISGDGVPYMGHWGKPWEGWLQRVAQVQSPSPVLQGGVADFTSCLQPKKHEMGMEKMLHTGGGKKPKIQHKIK